MNEIKELKNEILRLNLGMKAISKIIENGGVAPLPDNEPPFISMDQKGWGVWTRDNDGDLIHQRFDLINLMEGAFVHGWETKNMKRCIAQTERLLDAMKKDFGKYSESETA